MAWRPAWRGAGPAPLVTVTNIVWSSSIGIHARMRISRPSTPVGTIV
jgi:hypothetical protein